MPMRLPFNFPYFYNNYRYPYNSINHSRYSANVTEKSDSSHSQIERDCQTNSHQESKKHSENSDRSVSSESPECFFEIFGLKLYFDDVLIMCILFFLYKEEVQDEELFLCLILLLIS